MKKIVASSTYFIVLLLVMLSSACKNSSSENRSGNPTPPINDENLRPTSVGDDKLKAKAVSICESATDPVDKNACYNVEKLIERKTVSLNDYISLSVGKTSVKQDLATFVKECFTTDKIFSFSNSPSSYLFLNANPQSLFSLAVYANFKTTIKLLVDNGVDVLNYRCHRYAISNAAALGNLEVIKYLVNDLGMKVNADDGEALSSAAYYNHLDIVKFLLANGAYVNADKGRALTNAIMQRNVEVMKYLIEVGNANISVDDNRPLAYAASLEPYPREMVFYLIDKGADVNLKDGYIFVMAALSGDLLAVEGLFERGLNVPSAQSKALELAHCKDYENIKNFLLSKGITAGDILNESSKSASCRYLTQQYD